MKTRLTRWVVVLSVLLAVALLIPAVTVADVLPDPPDTNEVVSPNPATEDVVDEDAGFALEGILYGLLGLTFLVVVPLALTILIETPIIALAGRGADASWKVAFLTNALTNPIAVVLQLALAPQGLWEWSLRGAVVIGAIELAVVLVEWRVFTLTLGWSARKALVVSVLANVASFVLGTVLYNF